MNRLITKVLDIIIVNIAIKTQHQVKKAYIEAIKIAQKIIKIKTIYSPCGLNQ